MSNFVVILDATSAPAPHFYELFSPSSFKKFVCVFFYTEWITTVRREFKIYCDNRSTKPDVLIRLFHFGRTEQQLADDLAVTVEQVQRWKAGTDAVPTMAVRLLQQLDNGNTLHCAGPWNGSHANGSRLYIDCGFDFSIDFSELERWPTYRRLYHLHSLQTDLIERLMIERDFYRRECHQQARFGMVINQLFGL